MYYGYLIIDARSSDTRSVSEAAPIRKERASMTEFGEKRKTQGRVCMSNKCSETPTFFSVFVQ